MPIVAPQMKSIYSFVSLRLLTVCRPEIFNRCLSPWNLKGVFSTVIVCHATPSSETDLSTVSLHLHLLYIFSQQDARPRSARSIPSRLPIPHCPFYQHLSFPGRSTTSCFTIFASMVNSVKSAPSFTETKPYPTNRFNCYKNDEVLCRNHSDRLAAGDFSS